MSTRLFPRLISLSPRWTAILQALFVTFLWSTSWVLIKFGLEDIPALTFAGLRYGLAWLCLLPFTLTSASWASFARLSRRDWRNLLWLGVLSYAITQGSQFVALAYLPAVTTTLLLNFTTIAVALMSIVLLAERPNALQWAGVGLNLVGIFLYFYPVDLPSGQVIGIVVACVGVLANAGSAILGRFINRSRAIPPLQVTMISMGIGAALLLGTGLAVQGLPRLSLTHWAIIGWLAVVNSAFAFTLWNLTLQKLTAVESSIINNTMLIQIAILAWIFLGERVTMQEAIGMFLAALGVLLVQLWRKQ